MARRSFDRMEAMVCGGIEVRMYRSDLDADTCRRGTKKNGFGNSETDSYLETLATPMTCIERPLTCNRWPIGSFPLQNCMTICSLTMATGAAVLSSATVNSRPFTSGIPIVEK